MRNFIVSTLMVLVLAFAAIAAPAETFAVPQDNAVSVTSFDGLVSPDINVSIDIDFDQVLAPAEVSTAEIAAVDTKVTATRTSAKVPESSGFAIDTLYAIIGPRPLRQSLKASDQLTALRHGFKGFGVNHNARADV